MESRALSPWCWLYRLMLIDGSFDGGNILSGKRQIGCSMLPMPALFGDSDTQAPWWFCLSHISSPVNLQSELSGPNSYSRIAANALPEKQFYLPEFASHPIRIQVWKAPSRSQYLASVRLSRKCHSLRNCIIDDILNLYLYKVILCSGCFRWDIVSWLNSNVIIFKE